MTSSSEMCNDSINKKCGEITITLAKNAKNVYSFNCWFCGSFYKNVKKFTLHMETKHGSELKTDYDEEINSEIEPITIIGSFIQDIELEGCLVDINSENEEEDYIDGAKNSKKKEKSAPFQDPLETTENTLEEMSLMLPIKPEIGEKSIEITDEGNENEDVEITTFSDDNGDADYRSDFSIEEGNSSSSDYTTDDDQRPSKRAKHIKSKLQDKELITALIDAFKLLPQLWDIKHTERCSLKQKEELFQNMTENINVKLNQSLEVNAVKKKIIYLRQQYEKETERRMNDDEKNNAEKSDLWYYKKMEFLKLSTENKLKVKRRYHHFKEKPLSDKLLSDLIDIYKNYNSLWDVNHLAFTVKDKRNETMETMLEEIQNKMNLTLDICKLERNLAHIHKSFARDKQKKLECENKQQDFQSSCLIYGKCDFLDLHQGPFRCPTCNEIIKTYNDLQVHRSTHDGTAPFKCQECGSGFKQMGNFTIHARRHLGVFKFPCKICGKGYHANNELELHMLTHNGTLPYLCSVCGEGFHRSSAYDNHIRRHEERFRYVCHICKKGFNIMSTMNDHVKAHLNVRDFICIVCGKGFTSRKYLNHHRRIHEGKNYVCNICGKGFAQDAGLRAHKKFHGTPIGVSSIKKGTK